MTVVEWLFEQLDISQGYESAIEILEQAKEMEKEQKHAEYMRGWKDATIKQAPPPPLDRKIYK